MLLTFRLSRKVHDDDDGIYNFFLLNFQIFSLLMMIKVQTTTKILLEWVSWRMCPFSCSSSRRAKWARKKWTWGGEVKKVEAGGDQHHHFHRHQHASGWCSFYQKISHFRDLAHDLRMGACRDLLMEEGKEEKTWDDDDERTFSLRLQNMYFMQYNQKDVPIHSILYRYIAFGNRFLEEENESRRRNWLKACISVALHHHNRKWECKFRQTHIRLFGKTKILIGRGADGVNWGYQRVIMTGFHHRPLLTLTCFMTLSIFSSHLILLLLYRQFICYSSKLMQRPKYATSEHFNMRMQNYGHDVMRRLMSFQSSSSRE